jgi:hypothetical protein
MSEVGSKEAVLFCKKEPRNFCPFGIRGGGTYAPMDKSFLVLFDKKEPLAWAV